MKEIQDFICFVCKQKAKNSKKLDAHIRESHKGVKLYKCPCNKTFDRRQFYIDHVNSKHFVTKMFNCEKGCTKEFLTHSSRLHHYRTVHKDSFIKPQKLDAIPNQTY
jgi:uncharacterized C2H2 Zn-finger protein